MQNHYQQYQQPVYQQPVYLSTNPFATTQAQQLPPYGYGNVVQYPSADYTNYPNPFNVPMQMQTTVPMQMQTTVPQQQLVYVQTYVQPETQIYHSTISTGPLGQCHTMTNHTSKIEEDHLYTHIEVLFSELSDMMRLSSKAFSTDFYTIAAKVESLSESLDKKDLEEIIAELNNLKSLVSTTENPNQANFLKLIDDQFNKIAVFQEIQQQPKLIVNEQMNVEIEVAKVKSYCDIEAKKMNIKEAMICLNQFKEMKPLVEPTLYHHLTSTFEDKILSAIFVKAEYTFKNSKNENDAKNALNELNFAKELINSSENCNNKIEVNKRIDSLHDKIKTKFETTCVVQ